VRSCRVPHKTESRASNDHHIWLTFLAVCPCPRFRNPQPG
jgi:hypothetical protein